MRDNIKILGILNIILGSLGAIAGIVLLMVLGGLGMIGFWSASDEHAGMAVPIILIVGFCLLGLIAVLSIPTIVGGWGLLYFKPWARILMIIVSVFNLFHVPIGTALGVFGLYVLLNSETQRLFETGGAGFVSPAVSPSSPTIPQAPSNT